MMRSRMLMVGAALRRGRILGIYFGAGSRTMNLHEFAALHNIPLSQQYIWFPMVFVGFGVLGALFPFHTWSPHGHASAPTAVSMLPAGVLMTLGGYGCFLCCGNAGGLAAGPQKRPHARAAGRPVFAAVGVAPPSTGLLSHLAGGAARRFWAWAG